MKKKLLITLILGLILQASANAQAPSNNAQINLAIKKYKSGNYTGCLQDLEFFVKKDPSNAVAYYYIAISYAQAGQKDKAVAAYQKVLNLKPNPILAEYATTGKRCIETPDLCQEAEELSDLDKFIKQPYGDGLSKKVKDEVESKRLEALKNNINKDSDVNVDDLKKFRTLDKKSEAPTNDDVVNALKVLEKAGFSNLVQNTQQQPQQPAQNDMSEYMKVMNDPQIMAQNQQMQQIQMMMGNGNNNNNQNNNFMNMLPYMMAQNGKNGQSNMNPQLIQSMLMNSMMPNMDFGSNNNDRN